MPWGGNRQQDVCLCARKGSIGRPAVPVWRIAHNKADKRVPANTCIAVVEWREREGWGQWPETRWTELNVFLQPTCLLVRRGQRMMLLIFVHVSGCAIKLSQIRSSACLVLLSNVEFWKSVHKWIKFLSTSWTFSCLRVWVNFLFSLSMTMIKLRLLGFERGLLKSILQHMLALWRWRLCHQICFQNLLADFWFFTMFYPNSKYFPVDRIYEGTAELIQYIMHLVDQSQLRYSAKSLKFKANL